MRGLIFSLFIIVLNHTISGQKFTNLDFSAAMIGDEFPYNIGMKLEKTGFSLIQNISDGSSGYLTLCYQIDKDNSLYYNVCLVKSGDYEYTGITLSQSAKKSEYDKMVALIQKYMKYLETKTINGSPTPIYKDNSGFYFAYRVENTCIIDIYNQTAYDALRK